MMRAMRGDLAAPLRKYGLDPDLMVFHAFIDRCDEFRSMMIMRLLEILQDECLLSCYRVAASIEACSRARVVLIEVARVSSRSW